MKIIKNGHTFYEGEFIECDHCGYIERDYDQYPPRLLEGKSSGWICPACTECNTVTYDGRKFVAMLGYTRDIEVGCTFSG